MSATAAERAVIEVARRLCEADLRHQGGELANRLLELHTALRALDEQGPSLEDLSWIILQRAPGGAGQRAANVLMAFSRCVDGTRIATAKEFAALPWSQIFGARYAGPVTWKIWAEALQSLGIEPTWWRP